MKNPIETVSNLVIQTISYISSEMLIPLLLLHRRARLQDAQDATTAATSRSTCSRFLSHRKLSSARGFSNETNFETCEKKLTQLNECAYYTHIYIFYLGNRSNKVQQQHLKCDYLKNYITVIHIRQLYNKALFK